MNSHKNIRMYPLVVIVLLASTAGTATADFTFGTPTNLGPVVNSSTPERNMCFSADGLELYFDSVRPGTWGPADIWVSRRATLYEPPQSARGRSRLILVRQSTRRTMRIARKSHPTDRPSTFAVIDIVASATWTYGKHPSYPSSTSTAVGPWTSGTSCGSSNPGGRTTPRLT